ncbi:hypothetical protein AAK899_03695 [Erysipelotrichaceae bacterium 51-3]|uniref:hypothetical protein n=1 Tax=Allobaculum sp. JKK-2023 TaxID=3108943 RepID=UPI002B0530CD|nr:hypothetical protein [Allobaculum sp. JKK-2023]
MLTEEQAHIQWLKDKAQSLGLTFDQYMLFLIFESLDHSPAINSEPLSRAPWMNGYVNQDENPESGL